MDIGLRIPSSDMESSVSAATTTSGHAEADYSPFSTWILTFIVLGSIIILGLILVIILAVRKIYSRSKRKKAAQENEEFDIIDLYAGENKCLLWNSRPKTYPNIDFFVPELPVVFQQDPGIGPFSLYEVQKDGDETTECDEVGEMFSSTPTGTPVGTPVLNRSSDRWKSSLRRRISTTSASDLDVNLYKNGEEEETCGLTTIKSKGRLHLSVVHDALNHCVVVNILSAASLRLKAAGKAVPDTCVKLEIADDNGNCPSQSHCSRVFAGTQDPEYNISFCFNLDFAFEGDDEGDEEGCGEEEESGVRLVVALCTVDKFSRVKEVGRVVLPLAEVSYYAGGPGRVLDVWRDIIPKLEDVMSQGELSISLCYTPQHKSLSACVVRARGLVPPQPERLAVFPEIEDGLGLLYVKLTMLSSGTVLKRRKSSIRLHSVIPPLNNEHSFDVTPEGLDDVTIVFTVFSRDERGQRRMLGKTNVGSVVYTTGSGLEHWEAMISSPDVAVMRWHTLF